MQNDLFVFFTVFWVGLGLNLTPCVYPMLSVTVSIFSKDDSSRVVLSFFKASVYVFGMALMYSVLGTVASLSGGLFGQWLQNKVVLFLIGALIAGLALSMFGLYRLQMPAWIMTRMGGRRSGYFGLFVSGMVVGIFAAPCVGPPVVALMAIVSARQDPAFGFLVFFVLSLGLGLPYLILGTFSGLLKKMPKSGVWLIWVERCFGVVLLTFAAYYFLIAMRPSWLPWLMPVSLTAGGVYLGFIEKAGSEKRLFRFLKRMAGIMALVCAIVVLRLGMPGQVTWEDFSREGLQMARSSEQPVVLDFYADWCIPCHEMEATTYRDPQVIRELRRFHRIKVDVTDAAGPNTEMATGEYGIQGVPTMIFYGADGEEVVEARRTGYVGPKEFLQLIESI